MDNNTTQISDELNENREIYNFKEITLFSKVKGYLDLNRGKLYTEVKSLNAENYALPLYIGLTYNPENSTGHYGSGWRISLDKKLLISQKDTAQTTVYTYVDEAGNPHTLDEKYYVTEGAGKTFVSKEMLSVDINGNLTYNGKPVYKHQSYADCTLIPEINDFKGYELIEQRAEEQIGLEEYILQAEKQLRSYVRVNKANGAPSGNNVDFIASGNFTKEKYEAFLDGVTTNSDDVIITESERLKWSDLSETDRQILINGATANLDSIKYEYIKCFKKIAELETLVKNTPVRFLKDGGGIIEGFNAEGDLVLIADSYGNYLSIERGADGRIFNVFDSKKSVVKFGYVGGLLKSITDNRGRKVEYSYDSSNRLTKITYADGEVCNFTYNANNEIATVKPSSGETCAFSYSGSKLTRLDNRKSSEVILLISVDYYGDNKIQLYTYNGNTEVYTFNADNRLAEYSVEYKTGKKETKTYTYANGGKKVTVVTGDNVSTRTHTEITEYDEAGLIKSVDKGYEQITDKKTGRIKINYNYDENNRLILKETVRETEIFYDPDGDDIVTYTDRYKEKYSYDNSGKLTLTESYVQGEEKTSGINFEQRVYNDSGDMVKCIRWNSLDSSSKFYEEYEREEDGTVRYEKDETGAYSSLYEYVDGTSLVNSITFANGGKLAYGRNPYNDKVTSVTQSTAEGEANTNEIEYGANGLPAKVKCGNTTIEYSYDHKGRKTEIKVNGSVQSMYSYREGDGYDSDGECCDFGDETTYLYLGSGIIENVVSGYCDSYVDGVATMIVTSYKLGGEAAVSVLCNEKGLRFFDSYHTEDKQLRQREYSYDGYDRLTKIITTGSKVEQHREDYTYNEHGELTQKTITGDVTQTYTYGYKNNAARELESISVAGYSFNQLTDANGRNIGKEIYSGGSKCLGEYITYRKVGDHATNMPACIQFSVGNKYTDNIRYKYDSCGNICEITQNGHLVARYTYDTLNRLIREDNKPLDKTVIYTYDRAGNITERCKYAYTEYAVVPHAETSGDHFNYDYDGDKLVSYNGALCEYNNLGNPTKYRNNACEWQYGKLLTKYGGTTFGYDTLGRRTKKGNITYTYDNDNRLIKQSNGSNSLEFFYDEGGIAAVKYKNVMYFYRKDAQGNIIAILNSAGKVVVKYVYDAWGNNCILDENDNDATDGIGILNPFRYRGYYYDTETKLYYLQSRYYDPEVGRFISQDSVEYADPETINGLNLYAYCASNPVMNVDPTGKAFLSFLFFSIVLGAVFGGAFNTYKAYKEGASGWGLVGAFLGGAIMGGAMGAVMAIGGAAGFASLGLKTTIVGGSTLAAFGISVGIGIGAGLFSYSVETRMRNDKTWNWGDFAINGVLGGIQAGATFWMSFGWGRAGLFNRSLTEMSDVKFLQYLVNTTGKITTGQALVYSANYLVTNFISRFLLSTIPSTIVRWLISKTIKG